MNNNKTRDLILIALIPAMMGATAGISIPLFGLPPITLQTFFVFLAGYLLGPSKGAFSMIIYLLIGAIGIPVFSGYRGGLEVFLSGSGGFLIAFPVAAYFVGFMKSVKILKNEYVGFFLTLVLANVILYMFGASYIAYLTGGSTWLVLASMYLYWVGDLIKIIGVIYVWVRIRSAVTYEWA